VHLRGAAAHAIFRYGYVGPGKRDAVSVTDPSLDGERLLVAERFMLGR